MMATTAQTFDARLVEDMKTAMRARDEVRVNRDPLLALSRQESPD